MAIGNMHVKIWWSCDMWFLRHVQMNTQTDSHTCLSQYCAPLLGQSNNT